MHTNIKPIHFHHRFVDFTIERITEISPKVFKDLITNVLNRYADEYVNADLFQEEVKKHHGEYFQTAGYYVKLYRRRLGLTQIQLAKKLKIKQHHVSEIENNKRSVGKKLAKQIAELLKFDYKKLL